MHESKYNSKSNNLINLKVSKTIQKSEERMAKLKPYIEGC